jgi:hypothetical protein
MFIMSVILGRYIEIHTAEQLVPGPSHLEVEIAIAKLKEYKSPDSVQIPAELIQAGGEILVSVIHKFINSILNKEELPKQWEESIIVPIHKRGDNIGCNIIMGYHCCQLHTQFYRISFHGKVHTYFPIQWKIAQIIMIAKLGKSPIEVKSYRPISLLPIMAKVFEGLFLSRIEEAVPLNKLIPPYQFSFHENHSTALQCCTLCILL